MGCLRFQFLTPSETERAIAEVWLSIERFGIASPVLSFEFHETDSRLSMCAEFEDESVAMFVAQHLSTFSAAKEKQIHEFAASGDSRPVPQPPAELHGLHHFEGGSVSLEVFPDPGLAQDADALDAFEQRALRYAVLGHRSGYDSPSRTSGSGSTSLG